MKDYKHYKDITQHLISHDVKYPYNCILHFGEYVIFGKFTDDNFKPYAIRRGLTKVIDDENSLIKFNDMLDKFDIRDLSETDFDIITLELGILFS